MTQKQQVLPFELINDLGFCAEHKTIIVLGAERSGTSMTAQILHAIGVSMAPKLNATGQDPEFASLCLSPIDQEQAKKLIELRNQTHAIWGWKFPGNIKPSLYNLSRSPHFIVMLRDPLAMARKIRTTEDWQLAPAMRRVSQQQAEIAEFIAGTKAPVLFINYDRSLDYPDQLIKTIAEFSSIKLTVAKVTAAKLVIKPANPAYEKASSAPLIYCYVDTLTADNISGWVRSRMNTEKPVKIRLYIDGYLVESAMADNYRADLENTLMGSGRWGFSMPLPIQIQDGSVHIVEIYAATAEKFKLVYKTRYQKTKQA